jgi:hypothetical protein
MTRVLLPVLPDSKAHTQNPEITEITAFPIQDTKEYLADMLRELSVIAARVELHQVRELIDEALREVESEDASNS